MFLFSISKRSIKIETKDALNREISIISREKTEENQRIADLDLEFLCDSDARVNL